jgi:hypothetical protein
MQINPLEQIGLTAAYAVLTGLTVPVVDALGFPGHDTQIVAWAGIVAIPLAVVMQAYSSSKPGPLAPADPPVVVAATVVANLPPNAPEWSQQVKNAKAVATQAVVDHKP